MVVLGFSHAIYKPPMAPFENLGTNGAVYKLDDYASGRAETPTASILFTSPFLGKSMEYICTLGFVF